MQLFYLLKKDPLLLNLCIESILFFLDNSKLVKIKELELVKKPHVTDSVWYMHSRGRKFWLWHKVSFLCTLLIFCCPLHLMSHCMYTFKTEVATNPKATTRL